MTDLAGWTPFSAVWRDGEMVVDWCRLGDRRCVEPFFDQTLVHAMRRPFNLLFRQRTRADDLAAMAAPHAPTGFIFHMSRCGSTLCAQALAASPSHVVISEAPPIRSMLRAPEHGPVTQAQREAWLRGIVQALIRPRFGETRFFVKLMAADVLDLPLIRRVFPGVPWLFLFRDPRDILASLRAAGGADSRRGAVSAERLGLPAAAIADMPWDIYQCHVLAAFGRAALAVEPPGHALFLDYADLPQALETTIPAHFGFVPDAAERAQMRARLARDAKAPEIAFARAARAPPSDASATALAITDDVFAALRARAASA